MNWATSGAGRPEGLFISQGWPQLGYGPWGNQKNHLENILSMHCPSLGWPTMVVISVMDVILLCVGSVACCRQPSTTICAGHLRDSLEPPACRPSFFSSAQERHWSWDCLFFYRVCGQLTTYLHPPLTSSPHLFFLCLRGLHTVTWGRAHL